MSSGIALPHSAHAAASQGTLIESSRVAAEVYAAILVAQQCPRDLTVVQDDTRVICGMRSLAARAFYKYPKGNKTVTGPTIQLAKELVRIWRNTQWGIVELDRQGGRSELLAYAWDCETNSRSSRIVIVEHKRDKSGENPEDLTDMREIMTNNTNIASRHLRETIWTILPAWLTDMAVDLCRHTLEAGDTTPMPQRVKNCIDKFRSEFEVRKDQLVLRLQGRPPADWDVIDLANLQTLFQDIKVGQTTVEREFPAPVVETAVLAAVAAQAPEASAAPDPATDATPADPEPPPAADGLPGDKEGLEGVLADLFLDARIPTDKAGRAVRFACLAQILGLDTAPTSMHDLTVDQLREVIEVLLDAQRSGTLTSYVHELAEAFQTRGK